MIHLAIERHSNWFNALLWYHYEHNQSIVDVNWIGPGKLPWGLANWIDLTCIALAQWSNAVIRMWAVKIIIAASILLMPHLISTSLATERLDEDLLAGGSSKHSHAYMLNTHTSTAYQGIPADRWKDVGSNLAWSGFTTWHQSSVGSSHMYPCTHRQTSRDVLKAHIIERICRLIDRKCLFDYRIIKMPNFHWFQLLKWEYLLTLLVCFDSKLNPL